MAATKISELGLHPFAAALLRYFIVGPGRSPGHDRARMARSLARSLTALRGVELVPAGNDLLNVARVLRRQDRVADANAIAGAVARATQHHATRAGLPAKWAMS